MVSAEERERLRGMLLGWAGADERVTGAAITGSAAAGREDEWSDIDLLLGIEGAELMLVMEEWTERLRRELGALRLFDLAAGATTYRVFLLPSGLEVDLAFAAASDFGSSGPTFRAVFGSPVERRRSSPPAAGAGHLIGLGCHHVLHARASIARGKLWQAEHIIHALRDHVIGLACRRLGLESFFGREVDRLPASVTSGLQHTLVRSLEPAELRRALAAAAACLLAEARLSDAELAGRLERALRAAQPGIVAESDALPRDER